jgi:hypothetical protein
MSFISQQRNDILKDNNSAQTDFTDYLNSLDNKVSEIYLREPLNGDVDCAVLKELNFTHVSSIQFAPGNITSVSNIPDKITKFVCEDNLLINIPDLPKSLVELNLSGNGLKIAEFKTFDNLKELHLSRNQLVSIYELPKNLEILKCDNNNLKVLNLEGVLELRVLHCFNNPVLTIENYPDTITDLKMENSPALQIQGSVSKEKDKEKDKDKESETHADYITCLKQYFEMKQSYEKSVYDTKKREYRKAPTKKMARQMIAQIRPKCVNCKRAVGSIFETNERTYLARCGDAKNPCDFDIKIQAGEFGNLNQLYKDFSEECQTIKQEIIMQKMDTLFQYIDEKTAVQKFKTQLESFTQTNTFLKELEQEYNSIYFNEDQKEKIENKLQKISEIQERFRQLLIEYKKQDNEMVLKDAMHIYVNELTPEIKNLQHMKYATLEMDGYTLVRKPYTLSQTDFTFGDYPKVIKFKTVV